MLETPPRTPQRSPSCSSKTWRTSHCLCGFPLAETRAGNVSKKEEKWTKSKTLGPKTEQHLKNFHQLQPGEMKRQTASLLLQSQNLEYPPWRACVHDSDELEKAERRLTKEAFPRPRLSFRFVSDVRFKSCVHVFNI